MFGLELGSISISDRLLQGKLSLTSKKKKKTPLCFKAYQYSQSEISPAPCRHLTQYSPGFHQYYQLCHQKSVIFPQTDQRPHL